MSSTSAPKIKAFTAGGVIPEFTFVKFGADKQTIVACGLNERAIGIAQNRGGSILGDTVEVALPFGGAKLKLTGVTALGKMLTSAADGKGYVPAAGGLWVAAVAYEDGVAGDIAFVMVTGFPSAASDV